MKHLLILFRKDIHSLREEYLILLFISVVIGLARVLDAPLVFDKLFLPHHLNYLRTAIYFEMVARFLGTIYNYAVPALFLYATVSERMSGQVYQTYSLPCPRSAALLSKFASVVCMGTLFFLLSQFIFYFPFYAGIVPKQDGMFLHRVTYFLGCCLLYCGTFCAIEGFLSVVKRNRLLFGICFLITVMLFIRFTWQQIYNFYYSKHFMTMNPFLINVYAQYFLIYPVYPAIGGLLLAAAGLALTEKYGDV
jgi:ABC-type transport system involved in multi-copper enzyme maturation permease subunit